ncbi:Cytochrome c553 [Amphritea atlantica]|uniref:Cytochrome c553 n=1 Tax=Amphritea atlantica TaxID=355243 RepID=A0A1H9KRU2_9GAMM|nr:c-type cytochrome [Amphritea atlantica]SER01647.1 Cytochrome c553 [Amphritea atlantica]
MKKTGGIVLALCAMAFSAPVVHAGGAEVFQACVECHGASAEKSAMGKSQVIQGWPSSQIVDALNGYKAGTYGGPLKALMKVQVDKLDAAAIQDVAEHISGL